MNSRNALHWIAVAVLLCARPAVAAKAYNIDVVLPPTGAAAFLGKAEQSSLQQTEKILAKGGGNGGRPIDGRPSIVPAS